MPTAPPCETCRPELLPANEASLAIYNRVADEWLVGPGGELIGLPTPSIEAVLRLVRVPMARRLALLDEVKLLSRVVARAVNQDVGSKRDGNS